MRGGNIRSSQKRRTILNEFSSRVERKLEDLPDDEIDKNFFGIKNTNSNNYLYSKDEKKNENLDSFEKKINNKKKDENLSKINEVDENFNIDSKIKHNNILFKSVYENQSVNSRSIGKKNIMKMQTAKVFLNNTKSDKFIKKRLKDIWQLKEQSIDNQNKYIKNISNDKKYEKKSSNQNSFYKKKGNLLNYSFRFNYKI